MEPNRAIVSCRSCVVCMARQQMSTTGLGRALDGFGCLFCSSSRFASGIWCGVRFGRRDWLGSAWLGLAWPMAGPMAWRPIWPTVDRPGIHGKAGGPAVCGTGTQPAISGTVGRPAVCGTVGRPARSGPVGRRAICGTVVRPSDKRDSRASRCMWRRAIIGTGGRPAVCGTVGRTREKRDSRATSCM